MIVLRSFWKYSFIFLLGILIGLQISNSGPINSALEFAHAQSSENKESPSNWINEDRIKVYNDHVRIDINNPQWATFAPTKSMDPVFDQGAYAIQIKPKQNQLQVGDIITYRSEEGIPIIHRIIEIGNDGEWFAYVKGDNNPRKDPGKVRWQQVEKVLVAIIY